MARVSNKTRARRPAPAGAVGRDETDTLVERMIGSLWQAIAAGDLLKAELEAATCMALPRVGRLEPGDAQGFISTVLVDEAVRQRSPDAAAMMRLVMSLGSPATKRAASQALAQLTEAGSYPPEWVTEAGKAVPVQAWRRYDIFGDEEAIAVTFRYGEAEHGIIGHMDLTGIPIAIAVGVAVDLETPLARCDQEGDPGLSVDTLAYLPVARSRVRRLPAEGAEPAEVFTAADRAAAVEEFLASPLAAEAVAADEAATRFWAEILTGYSSRIPGEPPTQVGPRKMARILLGHVPNTFTLTDAQRQHLEPAVTAWTRWSAERRGLDEAATAHLTEGLADMLTRFDVAYDDADAETVRSYLADKAVSDADVAELAGHVARRMFAVPVPHLEPGAAPVDLGDPAVRLAGIVREFAACTSHSGQSVEEFRDGVKRVIAELWDDDPAQTFAEARRLFGAGADRHDIIHTLAERKVSPAGR
jgi:hypothetical protein